MKKAADKFLSVTLNPKKKQWDNGWPKSVAENHVGFNKCWDLGLNRQSILLVVVVVIAFFSSRPTF